MRLDKALASSGYGTRTEVRSLITKGKVTIGGIQVKDPGYHISGDDLNTVAVAGSPAMIKEHIYLLFDKPDEVLTAMEDPRLPHVGQFIPPNLKNRKISPVGRLDYHTTGLLILTNDGELSHRLTSPSYDIPKTYEVVYEGAPLTSLEKEESGEGIILDDTDEKVKLKPAVLELADETVARITLTEGKTHEVRRIFAHWGRPVITLRRISVGPVRLDKDSAEGSIRELTGEEINALLKVTGLI
ncbi:MAG: rRNA pseudouridine synthase [Clostridiales bacterium]|nr:rRNA pseudouridine synthase [Clostridiales bacterium]